MGDQHSLSQSSDNLLSPNSSLLHYGAGWLFLFLFLTRDIIPQYILASCAVCQTASLIMVSSW